MTAPVQGIARNLSRPVGMFATHHVSAPFRAALSASGATVEGFRPDRVDAALAKEEASNGANCVILWQDPAEAVAAAMEAGQDLDAVIDAWSTSARDVLRLFRRNRRCLLLVDARVLAAGVPRAERDVLRARLQLDALSAPADPSADAEDRIALLLARLLVPRIASIRDSLDELEASSLSLAPRDVSAADLAAAGEAVRRISAQGARLALLEDENALLKSQVALQQEEAERFLEEHRIASLASEKSLARALADLRTEAKSRMKLQEERDGLAREVKRISRKLEQVFASASWKVTRPIRKTKLFVFGGKPPADEAIATSGPKRPKG